MGENQEFVREFLVEAAENLDQLDRDLVALEENPRDPKRLASIFRTVHTIKGTSGFFGFSKLGAITHSGEHLLGQLRDGTIELNDRVTGALLTLVDAVRTILDAIEQTGSEGDADFRDLSQTLVRVAQDAAAHRPLQRSTSDIVVTRLPLAQLPTEPALKQEPEPVADSTTPFATPPTTSEPLPPAPAPQPSLTPKLPAVQPTIPVSKAAAEPSIRVDVSLLGSIVDLVGELVLARNQLQATVGADTPELLKVVQRIHSVTGALQNAAMKTRMQPIDHVFSKFPRIVRNLAVTCGKEVHLQIDGADTELDRSLIETIRDPLAHLLRNAVDHGIETPAARLAKGKPAAGRLSLRAFHESGQVTVEIKDDGGGIPVEAVRKKAVARGLVTAEEALALPDDRVLQFIFEPGFSTAAQVTDVSGRGVGMDVVKTNIESIGGTVDLASQADVGTTVRVRIPLTLAIIPALIVSSQQQRFAIPQAYVRELIALRSDRLQLAHSQPEAAAAQLNHVEGLEGAPMLRVRGRLLPLVFLDTTLDPTFQRATLSSGTVIILRIDDYEFGLVVDTVGFNADIVVKPIAAVLVSLGLYAGATVMGDGAVVLILDPRGIAQMAKIPLRPHDSQSDQGLVPVVSQPRYLLCETISGRRVAVPLEEVARLETFPRADLEQAAGHTVIHRAGRLMALADADDLLGTHHAQQQITNDSLMPMSGVERSDRQARASTEPHGVTAVILSTASGESDIGLQVQRILEVVEPQTPLNCSLRAGGVLGTIAIAGRATEVLDVRTALVLRAPDHTPQVSL